MVRLEGTRLYVDGPIVIDTVAALVAEGVAHVRTGANLVDLANVTQVDSSAVALALAWLREADAASHAIEFMNLPAAMTNLASLYGVADLIPVRRA